MISTIAQQCTTDDAETFFDARRANDAIDICIDCQVMVQCRDLARAEGHLYGVWGGETPRARLDWLAEHHPDPEVRADAATEAARLERDRQRSSDANREARARKRAEKAGLPYTRPPAEPGSNVVAIPTIHQLRAQRLAQRARQLLRDGVDMDGIAEELGTTRRSVQRYLSDKYDNIPA
ncbi:WhiB family transcriptional regulator [Micromonospora sp. WMMD736]|uniref:WhiB family transcriptional regulator n=1 Tax=Micromonospora sp. WMMD736 TaxID=3404112 RepID=UPI003B95B10F